MKKRCCSCGCTFTLSGSGKRQKYCPECAKRGDGRVWGLSSSNTLITKGAETPFEEVWVDRLSGLKDHEGPTALLGPEEQSGSVSALTMRKSFKCSDAVGASSPVSSAE